MLLCVLMYRACSHVPQDVSCSRTRRSLRRASSTLPSWSAMHNGSAAPRCNAGVTHHWGSSGLIVKRCAHLQGPILTAWNATAQLPTYVQTPSTPAGRPQTNNLCASAGRIPAGLNGCVGIKPSVGRLSNQGLVPAAASLDCITCFARSVRDAATVVRIMQVSHAQGQRPVLPSETHVAAFCRCRIRSQSDGDAA